MSGYAKQAQPDYVVASKYPRRDIIYLKEIFDRYDVDRSGSIERSELDLALSKDKAMSLAASAASPLVSARAGAAHAEHRRDRAVRGQWQPIPSPPPLRRLVLLLWEKLHRGAAA